MSRSQSSLFANIAAWIVRPRSTKSFGNSSRCRCRRRPNVRRGWPQHPHLLRQFLAPSFFPRPQKTLSPPAHRHLSPFAAEREKALLLPRQFLGLPARLSRSRRLWRSSECRRTRKACRRLPRLVRRQSVNHASSIQGILPAKNVWFATNRFARSAWNSSVTSVRLIASRRLKS